MTRTQIRARAEARRIYRRAMTAVIREFERARILLKCAGVRHPHGVIAAFIKADRKPTIKREKA